MRKLTKEQKQDIRAIAAKETKTLISRTLPRLPIGPEPKSASSIDQRRSPLRCVWIQTSSHGSKPMDPVTRPKRMGCCDTPCFTTREKRVLASLKASAGRPRNRKERLDHGEPVSSTAAKTPVITDGLLGQLPVGREFFVGAAECFHSLPVAPRAEREPGYECNAELRGRYATGYQ
jgi:hypothetical protein